jgi:hypothetical protein
LAKKEFVQAHAVELPPLAALQFGEWRRALFAFFHQARQQLHDFIGVGDVALVEGEMVLEQRVAESGHS